MAQVKAEHLSKDDIVLAWYKDRVRPMGKVLYVNHQPADRLSPDPEGVYVLYSFIRPFQGSDVPVASLPWYTHGTIRYDFGHELEVQR